MCGTVNIYAVVLPVRRKGIYHGFVARSCMPFKLEEKQKSKLLNANIFATKFITVSDILSYPRTYQAIKVTAIMCKNKEWWNLLLNLPQAK